MLLALAAMLAVLVAGALPGQAQTGPLTLADFDRSGLQVEALALFEAGGATTLYSAADSRWGANGSLVEGNVDLGADSQIVRVGLDDLTPEERHDYLQMLVEQVIIDRDNNVDITLAIPSDDDSSDPESPEPESPTGLFV